MKKIAQFISKLLLVAFLTLISQIGGIVWLLSWAIASRLKVKQKWLSVWTVFVILYITTSLFLLPPLAKRWGKEPLPLWATKEVPVQPASWLMPIFNRHYVKSEIKQVLIRVAKQMAKEFPNTRISYLDGNVPLLASYPLLPHLSHHDGKKLDISFFYLDEEGRASNKQPSNSGYGVFESPKKGGTNTTRQCLQKGYFQYDYPKFLTFGSSASYTFDSQRTKRLVQLFVQEATIGKAFIEPHLKQRLGLSGYNKIRFHGCQAVRHDDHLHVQLR